ncbi:MAG: Dipeptidyl aminopeptidase BIII [Planctomycetes bacterium]|nr:Dipeptidyl aminopeptidase BIII [Planctomycetota bacterium]
MSGPGAAGGEVPLLPRELLFGYPERASPLLSPDGTRLAWLAPHDGVQNAWVAPTGDVAAARPVTSDRGRGVRSLAWSEDGAFLLYVQDTGGDEDWHILAAPAGGGETRDLTPFPKVAARVQKLSPLRPGEVAVAINDRDPEVHDLWSVDLRTGARTLILRNDARYVGFLLDGGFRPVYAQTVRPDGSHTWHRFLPGGGTEVVAECALEDQHTTSPTAVTHDGRTAWWMDARGRDTAAVFEVDVASGARRLVAEHPLADALDELSDPATGRVQAVLFDPLRREWMTLDPGVAADLEGLRAAARGDAHVLSRTADDRAWTVADVVDDGPVRYGIWCRSTRTFAPLFTSRPALEGRQLARMQAMEIRARDGLRLTAYLTLPPGTPLRDGRPERPLPTVLWVHGGPWARDVWGWNPYHQWFANRGYAVLSVNYRGSTGFGKRFVNAADMQWARAMHDDLLDACAHTAAAGITDPARTAIGGGSYGGYATLVGLTMTPETFACGIDVVGPSNLVTLIESVPPYWKPVVSTFTRRVGDPATPEGRALLLERSPLTYADRIVRPLLIAQGANDPRVKQAESDQIVDALARHGIPCTYLLFPDEGHGFARPVNQLAFAAATEEFLAAHLGGRAEPPGDTASRSTVRISTTGASGGS